MKDNMFSDFGSIRKNSGMVLLCLFLGFLAWQAIRKNIGFEILVADIVVDVDVPENWAVWEKSVGKVDVLFRGSREDIRYLNNDQLRMVVDVENPSEGDVVTIKLVDKFLKSPTDASVVSFRPSEITVKLDRETEKVLPVKATFDGVLPEGLEIERIICTPATIPVTGAKRLINEMEGVFTEAITLQNRLSSFEASVPIDLKEAGKITTPPEWINVTCILAEKSDTKHFKDIPIRILSPSGEKRNIELQPSVINITVKGRSKKLDLLSQETLYGFISSIDLVENTGYDLPPKINLPPDLKVIEMDPPIVHVDITVSEN